MSFDSSVGEGGYRRLDTAAFWTKKIWHRCGHMRPTHHSGQKYKIYAATTDHPPTLLFYCANTFCPLDSAASPHSIQLLQGFISAAEHVRYVHPKPIHEAPAYGVLRLTASCSAATRAQCDIKFNLL